jgi:hypothetical protein
MVLAHLQARILLVTLGPAWVPAAAAWELLVATAAAAAITVWAAPLLAGRHPTIIASACCHRSAAQQSMVASAIKHKAGQVGGGECQQHWYVNPPSAVGSDRQFVRFLGS